MGEVDKHRHLVAHLCAGNGVELGSSGESTVPHGIQVDLPEKEYHRYNVERPPAPIHWRGTALNLPFKDQTLDWVSSVHLLEDWPLHEWPIPLREWHRVLRVGGHMIISVPDHDRFRERVRLGQGDNLSHKFEPSKGVLSKFFRTYEILRDDFVNDTDPKEYSLLFVGKRLPDSKITPP